MKMEDHFKETLSRAEVNEPPAQDAWARFEGRVRRARRIRLFASIAGATAAIVAAAIVVPKLGSDRTIITPSTNPPSSSPADPYAGWQTLTNATGLWTARFPQGWTSSESEVGTSFQPPGVEPVQKGLPTFHAEVRFSQGRFDPSMGGPYDRRIRADGRVEYGFEGERTKGGKYSHDVFYFIPWTGCAAGVTPCKPVGGTLAVSVVAGSRALWDGFGRDGEAIADSIRHIDAVVTPAATST